MFTLTLYTSADRTALHTYFSDKEILKYTNRGGYAMISLSGVYKSYFMLLREGDTIIGCGVIRRKYSREIHAFSWWLYDIWIHPDQRGRGCGTVLMDLLIANLRQRGLQQVYLVVANTNLRAQNLYAKIGFVLHQQQPDDKILRYDL